MTLDLTGQADANAPLKDSQLYHGAACRVKAAIALGHGHGLLNGQCISGLRIDFWWFKSQ